MKKATLFASILALALSAQAQTVSPIVIGPTAPKKPGPTAPKNPGPVTHYSENTIADLWDCTPRPRGRTEVTSVYP